MAFVYDRGRRANVYIHVEQPRIVRLGVLDSAYFGHEFLVKRLTWLLRKSTRPVPHCIS